MANYYPTKTIADLEKILGKSLAKAILTECGGGNTQAKPRGVTIYREKPAYYLNDGDTLHFFNVDLAEGKILDRHFGGSADTAINHAREQFAEGVRAIEQDAVLIIRYFWNGKNMSWTIDVITEHEIAQLSA